MHDAGAGTHPLHLTSPQYGAVTHRIGMGEFPINHHRDDLHVAVGVHPEAFTGCDGVVVDHPQRAKTHPVGMVMTGEGKAVPGVQPTPLAVEAFIGGSEQQGWRVHRGDLGHGKGRDGRDGDGLRAGAGPSAAGVAAGR